MMLTRSAQREEERKSPAVWRGGRRMSTRSSAMLNRIKAAKAADS